MSARSCQPGEDKEERMARSFQQDRAGEDDGDRTTVVGQPAQYSRGRIVKIGQLGHVSPDRLTWTGQTERIAVL
jgi:hypothetical protein